MRQTKLVAMLLLALACLCSCKDSDSDADFNLSELYGYWTGTQSNANQRIYLTFNEDKTFQACIAGKAFSGTWTLDEATAKVSMKTLLLTINCYAKREYKGIALLFESKKLLNVLQLMAALSGNDTVQKVGELSKNYDGIRLGFDMKK